MQQINIIEDISTPRIKSLTFHHSRPILLLAFHNGQIKAFDHSLSQFIYTFEGHEGPVRSLDFHPFNDLFCSGGDDQFVRIWDYSTKTHFKLKGHTDYIRCVKFHKTDPLILSCSDDRTIKIWNFQNKKKVKTLSGHTNYVMQANFLDNDRIISVSLDQTIRIWNIENGLSEIIEAHEKGINTIFIDFQFNNFSIFTGSDDRLIKKFNSNLIQLDTFSYHTKPITSIITLKNMIISCGEDGFIFFNKNKQTNRIETKGRFWCLAKNNKNLVAAGSDSNFFIFSVSKNVIYNQEYFVKNDSLFNYENEKIMSLKKEVFSISSNNICSNNISNSISSNSNKTGKDKNSKKEKNDKDGKNKFFILNYAHKFEIYKNNSLYWHEQGNAIFHKNFIISNHKNNFSSFNLNGTIKKENFLFIESKKLNFECFDNFLYLIDDKKLIQCVINDNFDVFERKEIFLPFSIEELKFFESDAYTDSQDNTDLSKDIQDNRDSLRNREDNTDLLKDNSDSLKDTDSQDNTDLLKDTNKDLLKDTNNLLKDTNRDSLKDTNNTNSLRRKVVVKGKNDLIILSQNLKIKKHVKEMVKINSLIIQNNLIFYTTEKQLKYLNENIQGNICSVDNLKIIKILKNEDSNDFIFNAIFLKINDLNDLNILKKELNFKDIIFKESVIENKKYDLNNFINYLPGMMIIEFLKKFKKGNICLPFIKDKKERFSIFLSNGDLTSAYELMPEKYQIILDRVYKEPSLLKEHFNAVEKIFIEKKDSFDFFIFLLCCKKIDKIKEIEFNDLNSRIYECVLRDDREGVRKILQIKESTDEDFSDCKNDLHKNSSITDKFDGGSSDFKSDHKYF